MFSCCLLLPQTKTRYKYLPNATLTSQTSQNLPPSPGIFQSHLSEITRQFTDPVLCFTDGSKRRIGTSFAYSIDTQIEAARHCDSASIFTAELQAIFCCIATIVDLQNPPIKRPFLILSDSLSSLQAIQNIHSDYPLVQRIHLLLHTLTNTLKEITFIWVPSHIGIKGNERIDQAAIQAQTSNPRYP